MPEDREMHTVCLSVLKWHHLLLEDWRHRISDFLQCLFTLSHTVANLQPHFLNGSRRYMLMFPSRKPATLFFTLSTPGINLLIFWAWKSAFLSRLVSWVGSLQYANCGLLEVNIKHFANYTWKEACEDRWRAILWTL